MSFAFQWSHWNTGKNRDHLKKSASHSYFQKLVTFPPGLVCLMLVFLPFHLSRRLGRSRKSKRALPSYRPCGRMRRGGRDPRRLSAPGRSGRWVAGDVRRRGWLLYGCPWDHAERCCSRPRPSAATPWRASVPWSGYGERSTGREARESLLQAPK